MVDADAMTIVTSWRGRGSGAAPLRALGAERSAGARGGAEDEACRGRDVATAGARGRGSARPARSVSWLLARSARRVTGHEHGVAVGVEHGWASRAPAALRQKLDEVLSKTGVAARWRSMAAAARR